MEFMRGIGDWFLLITSCISVSICTSLAISFSKGPDMANAHFVPVCWRGACIDLQYDVPFSLIGNSADYTWALVIIASLIMSLVLFHPFLNALTVGRFLTQYIWAAQMPDAQVSMMGMLALPAKYLPYANLAIDLIIGGPSLMIEAATGLASAFLWDYVRRARMPPGTSLRPGVSLDGLLVKYIQPCLSTPAILRTWMNGNARTRQTAYGTAYTPRTSTATPSSSWSWFARRPGQTPGSSGSTRRGASGIPDRDALRAAAEARLRTHRTE